MIAQEVQIEIIDLSKEDFSVDSIYNTILDVSNERINFIYLGINDYLPVWQLQQKIHEAVKLGNLPNIILLLEHDHVYTLGKNANKNYLLNSYPKDVQVIETDRGGQITYHGPGQLIGYPIINLNQFKKSVSWYMRTLEEVIIETLKNFSITSDRKDGMTGVWVDDEKICAMGVRLARWVSMHGFALNINPDMNYYNGMIPCGIQEYGITSMNDVLNKNVDLYNVMEDFSINFLNLFERCNEEI